MVAKGTLRRIVGMAGLALAVGAAVGLPVAWAQSAPSTVPQVLRLPPIDRSLPGAKQGLLTSAKGTTMVIDRDDYVLALGAALETQHGAPVMLQRVPADNVEYRVQYWLGTGIANKQITQMIIFFPE